MSAMQVVSRGDGNWEINGELLAGPEGPGAPDWVMARVLQRVHGTGPWPVTVIVGDSVHDLILGADGSVIPADEVNDEPSARDLRVDAFLRRARGKVGLIGLAIVVVLACLIAFAFVLGGRNPGPGAAPAPSAGAAAVWHVDAVPGEASVAAGGVLVTAGSGMGQVFSLADGKPIETVQLPEGHPRVVSGTDWVAVVVSGANGTNTGFVASAGGVKKFQDIHGSLVARGADPFFLTGVGKDQSALVWDGSAWKPATAPEPGLAPVAASKAGVLWLGANGRIIAGKTTATLAAPGAGAKTAGWVWADEKSVAVLWDGPQGEVLAVHAVADGKITGQTPVNGEVRKDGGLVVSGQTVYTLDSGTPVAAEACTDPVLAGSVLWCQSEQMWAAKDARPLAPGESPVPSPAELVVTSTAGGFTAYAGDEITSSK